MKCLTFIYCFVIVRIFFLQKDSIILASMFVLPLEEEKIMILNSFSIVYVFGRYGLLVDHVMVFMIMDTTYLFYTKSS